VRNCTSGGNYKYIALSNVQIPNAWTRAEGYISGLDATASGNNNQFPYGTAYVQVVFLNNNSGGTSPTNTIRWSDIWLSELSARNLESASATVPGVVSLVAQSLGAGDKYFGGKVGIGTLSVPSLLTLSKDLSASEDYLQLKDVGWAVNEAVGMAWSATADTVLAAIRAVQDAAGDWVLRFYTTTDTGATLPLAMELDDLGNATVTRAVKAAVFQSSGDEITTLTAAVNTTTAAPAALTPTVSGLLTLADQDCWFFTIFLAARRTDADGEGAAWKFEGCIDRNGATTALVGDVLKTVVAKDVAAWDAQVLADDSTDSLLIQVTGEAAKTIRWIAHVQLTEVNG
jgi:hypothetical protein